MICGVETIIGKVKDYYDKEIKIDKSVGRNPLIQLVVHAYEGRKVRVISALYQALHENRCNSTNYIKDKWDRELEKEMTEEEWENVCRIQHSTTALEVLEGVWLEECHPVLHITKSEGEVCTRT